LINAKKEGKQEIYETWIDILQNRNLLFDLELNVEDFELDFVVNFGINDHEGNFDQKFDPDNEWLKNY